MYHLNEAQQAIVDRAATIADEVIGPHAADVDEKGRFPQEAVDALAREGFLGLTVPREYGGMGEGIRMACAVLDQVSQRDASVGLIYLMHLCGVACYAARPEAAIEQLDAAARGEHLSTLAWSEHGSRSHFWAPVSRATFENGKVSISAEKSWVTSAGHADGYVVSTGTPGGEAPLDTMLYLVLKDDAGLNVSGPWDAMGMRGNSSAPMVLDHCTISAERALSADSKGFETMLGVVLPVFQLGNAAISIGLSETAVAATTRHLTGKRFEESDTKLADLPTLRARLAQMRIETDRARAHLVAVIDSVENPSDVTTLLVLETKAQAADTALLVSDLGMRACGGAAFSKHLGLDRQFRDARAASVMAPTTDVLHDFIGRALCGMDLF